MFDSRSYSFDNLSSSNRNDLVLAGNKQELSLKINSNVGNDCV